jgi:branched-subunit amino acid aminotransferase/4-amino-4-deoxychorismate lyase
MTAAIVWREGRAVPAAEAVIPALDAGVLYGDGLFETMRAHSGTVERLDEHLDRMVGSAASIDLVMPPREELSSGVVAAVQAAGFDVASVRLTVTRGTLPAATPRAAAANRTPNWWVIVSPVSPSTATEAVAVLLPQALSPPHPGRKSLSWQHAVVAQLLAGDREGIYVDAAGEVTEAISSNVFTVTGSELRTPPSDRCLPGVTRATVLELAGALGLRAVESPLFPDDLHSADEVLLSSSVAGVRAVTELDGRPIADGRRGPIAIALRDAVEAAH